MGAVAAGCSSDTKDGSQPPAPSSEAGASVGSSGSGGMGGSQLSSNAGMQATGRAGQGAKAGSGSMTPGGGDVTVGGSGGSGKMGAAGGSAPGSGGAAGGFTIVEAKCGPNDKPETGLQGDAYPGTVNCGLTLLADVPSGGSVQGSGHCAYMRGTTIKAYDLTDPLNPKQTDEEPTIGATESMRAQTVDGRAVLVSGSGVYDISNCEDIVKKGEIKWPSSNYQGGLYVAAITGHEIGVSHDAKRVYGGLGFSLVNIENLEQPVVKNWTCEMIKQGGKADEQLSDCEGPTQDDFTMRQFSHSSDDNLEGTVWYGADQLDTAGGDGPLVTAHMVDISDPNSIKILDTVHDLPGHSMNWWRTPSGRDFIIGANEGFGSADSCQDYPRPTDLGNDLDAYIAEVTDNKFGKPFHLTLDINKPENCKAAQSSGAHAAITETSIYNRNGAAFVMIEYGGAGLRVFDLRDGENPREVAYYNDGKGHVHSGVFYYDDARGIMLASGSQAMHVLMLQPQMIEALGLPKPTDPAYPYK